MFLLFSVVFFVLDMSRVFALAQISENITQGVIKKTIYDTKCDNDKDCMLNAYCHKAWSRCTCKDGFIPDKESPKGPVHCIKEASDIEDYCEKDTQCQAALGLHSYCFKPDPTNAIGKCKCNPDAHFIDRLCYKTSRIGDTCQVNDNCLIRNKDIEAFCEYSRCVCPPLHHSVRDGTDCARTSVLYGPCLTSDSCITMNAECSDGFCRCKGGYHSSFDNSSCLYEARRIGDPCEEDSQCLTNLNNSICVDGVCECQEGTHPLNDQCWNNSKLFGPCIHENECRRDEHRDFGMECKDEFCVCKEYYTIEDNTYCKRFANMSDITKGGASSIQFSLSITSIILSILIPVLLSSLNV